MDGVKEEVVIMRGYTTHLRQKFVQADLDHIIKEGGWRKDEIEWIKYVYTALFNKTERKPISQYVTCVKGQ